MGAMTLRLVREPVVPPRRLGHLLGLDVGRHLRQRQVASGGHRGHQPAHDAVRVVGVDDQMHDGDQHVGHRAGEVQRPGRLFEDLLRGAQVRVDVVGDTLRGAGKQRPGVGEHDRVVVHVDHAAVGRHCLRHLVGVVRRRDPGADVEELPDPGLGGEEPHDPGQERPVGPHRHDDPRIGRDHRVTGGAVGREVILAAQPVVMHPGAVGHLGVKGLPVVGGDVGPPGARLIWFAGHW